MPKLQIKATELVDTDVNFVSLVKRGANRIPFRITKEDEPMLDLHKIGRTFFKKTDPKPEIVAAIVQEGADLSKVAAIFKSAGLDPKTFTKSEPKDGIVTVAKADADKAEDTVVLKVSDEVGLVVSGLKKTFDSYAYNSTDFNVVMATEGVYPSMCVAKDALGNVIGNILYKASSPAEAADQLGQAIDDFKTYMTGLLTSVPVQAFKADLEFAKAGGMAAAEEPAAPAAEQPAKEVETQKSEAPAASDEQPVAEVVEEPAETVETEEVEKADAGKNGTGAGFEKGKGTGTDPKATEDDKKNTAVNSTGKSTTGNSSEGPAKAKKEEVAGLPQPEGHEPGDDDGFAAAPSDSDAATARATADDKKMRQNGDPTGSTIPDGDSGIERLGGIHKNEGDADVGKKGKGKTKPGKESGAGAQQAAGQEQDPSDVTKADNSDVMAAIAALTKSVEGMVGEVRNEVGALAERVDQVGQLARKTDEALHGTVFNETDGDREPDRVSKSDSAPPLLDTAYSRRTAA